MKRSVAIALLLCCAGADECKDDDLTERAPPGERGVSSNGVAYENPTPTSGSSEGPHVDSATIGTGGVNITIKR